MNIRLVLCSVLVMVAVSLVGFSASMAEDDMPMGQGNTQPSKMGSMEHDMMMPMDKGGSQQSKMSGSMPMGQGNSQPSQKGDMQHDMKMPMGQGDSQKSKMGGMGMGCGKDGMKMPMGGMQSNSSQSGGMGMDEHASHHGGGMSSSTSSSNSMQLPNSSLQDQVQIEELSQKRINTASNMITEGVLVLSRAKESNDRSKMHDALKKVRDGVNQFESGLAAQEALDQGVAPRNIAIQWFKNELNLTTETNHGDIFGISWFHFFVMVALVFFAVIMLWMYFFKMRRATEILNRVTGGEKDAGSSKKAQDGK